jgi:hypothetical protein
MISPLASTFVHAVHASRTRDRQPGNENFRDLLNADPSHGDSPAGALGENRTNTPPSDERMDRQPATGEHAPGMSNDDNVALVSTPGNGLVAQTPSQSPLGGSTTASTMPTLEAARIALTTTAVHVTTGAVGDNVELVAMPWRLQANGGLSYCLTGAKAQALPESQSTPCHVELASMPSARATVMSQVGEVAVAESHASMSQNGAANLVSDRVQRSAQMSVAADVAMPGRTASALLLWPHRLLRWLADNNTGLTAWVRDYRLDASQATQLVDSLRCLAEQQGHTLHRIMLNGHELWRAPSTPDSN